MDSNHRSSSCKEAAFAARPQDRVELCGSRGTRTPKSLARPTVFKTASSSSRMASGSCGGWNRANTKAFRAPRPAVRRPRSNCLVLVPGVGIEPTDSWFKARHHYQQRRPRNDCSRVPCGSRARLAGLEARSLCRSAKDTSAEGVRVELTSPPEADRLLSRQLPSPVGLPFHLQLRWEDSNLQSST